MTDIHEAPTGAEQVHAAPAAPAPTPQPNPIDGTIPGQQDTTIPGTSFKSQEELVNAFKSLQAEYTKLKQKPEEEPQPEPAEDPTQTQPETAPPDDDQFDWLSVTSQYNEEKGEWDSAVLERLEKVGIPAEALDRVRGLEQIAHQYFRDRAETIAGGKEQWEQVQQFIAEHMPQVAEDLNDPNKYEYVIEAAMARMNKSNPQPEPNREPSPAPNTSTSRGISDPYLLPNSPEAVRAMADPRFRTDVEYQKTVREQIQRGALIAARQRS